MQTTTTVTFTHDKIKREESADHDFRKDLPADSEYFKQKGHEHILQQYCKYNIELVNESLEDFYDSFFTEKLAVWSDKQKHKSKRLNGGQYLPPGVTKAESPYWAKAYAYKIYLMTGEAVCELPKPTDDDWEKVSECYDEINRLHPKSKVNYFKSQYERFAMPITAGEAYLKDLRRLMAKNGKSAQRTSYAFIAQVGSFLDPDYTEDRTSKYWSDRVKILEDWLEDFKKRHPHLHVTKAVIHVDEYHKPPHLHLEVVPAVDSDRGKPLKVSYSEALKRDGFNPEKYEEKSGPASYNARRKSYADWTETECQSLATLCKDKLGLERTAGNESLKTLNGTTPEEVKAFMSQVDENHIKLLKENRQLDDKNLAAAAKLKQAEAGLKQSVEKKQSVDKAVVEAEAKLQALQTQLEDAESRGLEAKKKALRSQIADMQTTLSDLQTKSQQASDEIAEKRQAFDDEKAEFFGEKKTAVDAVKQVYQGLNLPVPAGIEDGNLSVLSSQVTTLMQGITDQGKAYQDAKTKADAETKRADMAYADEVKAIETSKASFETSVQGFFKACGMTPPAGDVTAQVAYLSKHKTALAKRYKTATQKVTAEEARADTAYADRLQAIADTQARLDKKEQHLDDMIEKSAVKKAKAKIKAVIDGFYGRIRQGYGAYAYKIKHRRGGYDKDDAAEYGALYRDGFKTVEEVNDECLSRRKGVRVLQQVECTVAGFWTASTNIKDDAKTAGVDLDDVDTSLPLAKSSEDWSKKLKEVEKAEKQLRDGKTLD